LSELCEVLEIKT